MSDDPQKPIGDGIAGWLPRSDAGPFFGVDRAPLAVLRPNMPPPSRWERLRARLCWAIYERTGSWPGSRWD